MTARGCLPRTPLAPFKGPMWENRENPRPPQECTVCSSLHLGPLVLRRQGAWRGFTWTKSLFLPFVIFFFHDSTQRASTSLPLYSLILPLKCLVTSVQIKVEFRPCWTLFPIVVVCYWLKSVLSILSSIWLDLSWHYIQSVCQKLWKKSSALGLRASVEAVTHSFLFHWRQQWIN